MKIIQPKHTKKIIIATSTAILVLLAALSVMFYLKVGPFDTRNNTSINLDSPTDEEINAGKQTKKQTIDQTGDKANNIGSDPSPAPQPIEGSDKKSVNVEITATNQDETTLRIRTLIQTITNSGTCTITMTNPAQPTYTTTVPLQALSSASTCKGFDIPLDELHPGTWNIVVEFMNDELIGSASKSVDIK